MKQSDSMDLTVYATNYIPFNDGIEDTAIFPNSTKIVNTKGSQALLLLFEYTTRTVLTL